MKSEINARWLLLLILVIVLILLIGAHFNRYFLYYFFHYSYYLSVPISSIGIFVRYNKAIYPPWYILGVRICCLFVLFWSLSGLARDHFYFKQPALAARLARLHYDLGSAALGLGIFGACAHGEQKKYAQQVKAGARANKNDPLASP
jgi:uncharacterized membrane protein YwzB